MKRLSIAAAAIISAMFLVTSCEKNEIKYGEWDPVTGDDALLKINFVSSYASNPQINISIDGNRVSNPITSRTPFPGGGYNTGGGSTADYLALTPGQHTLKIAVPFKGTGQDSLKLYETSFTVEGGKAQTMHITDTAENTKYVMLVDDRSRPDSGEVRYKFVNLMPDVPSVDLYFGNTVVAANVGYMEAKEFTGAIPPTATPWTVRASGDPSNPALATYSSTSTYTNRRVYTAFALGYGSIASGTQRPYISFLLNL